MTGYNTPKISSLLLTVAIGQLLHGSPHREALADSVDDVPRAENPTNPPNVFISICAVRIGRESRRVTEV
jgi:hypothetical protein